MEKLLQSYLTKVFLQFVVGKKPKRKYVKKKKVEKLETIKEEKEITNDKKENA